MSFVDPPIPLPRKGNSMQHKSVPLLIKGADDQSGLSQSPRERPPVGLNRHRTDFKNGRPASATRGTVRHETLQIHCKTPFLPVAGTSMVRARLQALDRPRSPVKRQRLGWAVSY